MADEVFLQCCMEGGNHASILMLTKFGFTNEGSRKECEIKKGSYIDLYSFAPFNPAHAS
jgi:RimJ/RimL family protein N-acetyltransferase